MDLVLGESVEDCLVDIASSNNLTAKIEVAKSFAFFKYLEEKLSIGSSDFWNVSASANGKLTAGMVVPGKECLWRLYATHVHCVAILQRLENGDIYVHAICSHKEIEQTERRIISQSQHR